jgi:hypothetical protein
MNPPTPAALYEVYGRELSELLDLLLAGEVVADRAVTERLVRSVGALAYLHERHRLDRYGRCPICWSVPRTWWRRWPKRSTCTVHTALGFYLRQPARFVLAVMAGTHKSTASGQASP